MSQERNTVMPTRRTLAGATLAGLAAPAAAQRAGPRDFAVTPPGPDTPTPLPGPRSIGREDAPVVVTEYHSLTCGNCANFHANIFPRIKAAYVEPGLVRFVLRDYPLDRLALDAAALVHCGGPERFESLVSLLYARKEDWAHSSDARGWLRRTGQLAGITAPRIEACWSDRGFMDPILAGRLEAERDPGVDATPTFVIGGRTYKGVLSFERFAEIVRPLLPAGSVPRG